MEDDTEIRKTRYKQMSTQELLELHAAGILSSMLYDVLESELRERGATIPSRPKGDETLAEGEKRSPYAIGAWILPLIGSTSLLVTFLAGRGLDIAIGLFLSFLTAGAGLTVLAFVERKRFSNSLKHAAIGLFVNLMLIIICFIAILVFIGMGMSGKFGY